MDSPKGRVIRQARPEEADALTELTFRSKAYWGYTPAFMQAARAALIVTPDQIDLNLFYVVEKTGTILGYYSLEQPDGAEIVLESLFIAPEAIGSGCGALLLQHALETARAHGYQTVVLASDPNAEGFYRRMGAERFGETPGATPGRMLPLMRFRLDSPAE